MDNKNPSPSPTPDPSVASNGDGSGGTSKFLANLPSRGFFSSSVIVPSSNPGGMRVYVCDHDTSPPEDQHIKTNQMNILIRSLLLKKQHHRNDSTKSINIHSEKGSGSSRKRAADKSGSSSDGSGKASSKRAATGGVPGALGDLKLGKDLSSTLTVERLRALLKEKGLSVKGKKDELIARLRSATG